MPNLYIIQQIERNTRKALSCIKNTFYRSWDCINKYSTKFANGWNKQVVGRITRKANKYKKCLRITCIILAILGLIAGLFMGSFKSAGAREQGLEINHTEGVLKQQYITNDWKYTGLNGYIEVVPKQKLLVQFINNPSPPSQQSKTHQIYGPIEARVTEGTKLFIQAIFQCSIVILDDKNIKMKEFFDTYGFNQTPGQQSQLQWMTYLRQKLTNMVIQTIAKQSFYSISNMDLKTSLNTQLSQLYSQFNATFPFQISVLSLTINYPPDSFSVNNTLGTQLLKAKSLLAQLKNQYDSIQAYIVANKGSINSTYIQNAALSASINSGLLGVYDFDDWLVGLDLITSITTGSTWPSADSAVNLQKFMWLYFNNIYNATYRQQRLAVAMNSSNFNQRQVFLQQQLSLY